jgi:hypothetical protein
MLALLLRGVVVVTIVVAALVVGDQLRASREQLASGRAGSAASAQPSPPTVLPTAWLATLPAATATASRPPAYPTSAPPRTVVPTPIRAPSTDALATLSGTVTMGGQPVRGAEIVVYPADSSNRGPTPVPPDSARTVTDDRGGYRVAVHPGVYRVGAFRSSGDPSKHPSDGYTWVTWYGDGYVIGLGKDVAVTGSGAVANIAMLRSIKLAGRVVGRDGVAVPNASLTLTRDVNGIQFPFGGAISDAAGRFDLAHVAMQVTLHVAVTGRLAPSSTALALDLLTDRTDLLVTLDRGHVVTGTLRDAAGRPLANTGFGATPTDPQIYCYCNAMSDGAGRFALTVPTGSVTFRTWPSRPGEAELISKEYRVAADMTLDPVLEGR